MQLGRYASFFPDWWPSTKFPNLPGQINSQTFQDFPGQWKRCR